MRLSRQFVVLLGLSVASLSWVGCAAVPTTPTPPPVTPPTSANVAGTTIVAIQAVPAPAGPVPNLLDFTGVTHILESVTGCVGGTARYIQNILGSRFPHLESRPPLLAITDPANLGEQSSPAVQVAAQVKAEEDAAPQKIKGIRYLATIGCGGCYPDVEKALLAALDDCTEEVRYEAVKAIRSTVGNACVFCKADACCGPAVRKKLKALAYDIDKSGCFSEPSGRVRRLARLALNGCGWDQLSDELPEEGPDETTTTNAAGDANAILINAVATIGPEATESQVVSQVKAIAAASDGEPQGTVSAESIRVAWEEIMINPADFESVERARQIMLYLKARADAKEAEKPIFSADEVSINRFESSNIDSMAWKERQDYLKTLHPGTTSPILTRNQRWYLIRVLSRTVDQPK